MLYISVVAIVIKRIVILNILLLCGFISHGQLTTNTSLTPQQLVENILVGQGVTISNVTYTGSINAIGQFNGVASNIGIDQGIILSTGTVLDQVQGGIKNGPVGPNNNGGAGTSWFTAGDASLSALINDQTYDAAVLEFDFIPQGDTVKFNYVFASEEYIEFVGTQFNDVFAFFIDGPGFVGETNIAIVPGTALPVSISNINHTTNNTFFIQNGNGSSGTQQTDQSVVNFDGFTIPLTAVAKVTPCQTYHLKIAIADVADATMDSGMFLQGGSLNSNLLYSFEKGLTFNPLSADTLIAEGCADGRIVFERENKIFNPLTLNYSVGGTATEGVDYNLSQPSISFGANESRDTIEIQTISDALLEGSESVILRIKNPSVCIADSIEITYFIVDQTPLTTSTIRDTITCAGESSLLSVDFSGGIPDYSVSWSTGDKGSELTVKPPNTTKYLFTVSDTCGNSIQDSAIVTVPVLAALDAIVSNDTTVKCPGLPVSLFVEGVNGGGSYDYAWSTGETSANINNDVSSSTTYSVTVTDNCGSSISKDIDVNLDYPDFSVVASNDTIICKGGTASLSALASGGRGNYTYVWETGQIGENTSYSGTSTSYISVTATDSCGIVPASDSVLVTIQQPIAKFGVSAPVPEISETVTFEDKSVGNDLIYDWDFGNGESSTVQFPETSYSEDTVYTITLFIEDDLGCKDSTTRKLEIFPPLYYYIANAFTPNGDGLNDEFIGKGIGVGEFSLAIYDRWGIEIFSTDNYREGWDGTTKTGKKIPDGVYVYRVIIKGESGREIERIGHVTVLH